MRSYWKLTLLEGKLFMREPIAAFFALVFPLMILFIFGSIYGNEPAEIFGGRGSMDVQVPAYIAMIIGSVALSIAINVSVYRERGILRRYRATPLQPQKILAANVLVYFWITLIGAILLIVAAKIFFDLHFEGNWLSVLAGFILCCLSFFALGFLLAAVAPTARVAQVVGMALFYPMLFLSGAGMPREIFPESLQNFSKFLPLTYVVDLMKGLWFGGAWRNYLLEVGVLVGLLVVGVLLASRFFRWE